jgi:hypothetical protein
VQSQWQAGSSDQGSRHAHAHRRQTTGRDGQGRSNKHRPESVPPGLITSHCRYIMAHLQLAYGLLLSINLVQYQFFRCGCVWSPGTGRCDERARCGPCSSQMAPLCAEGSRSHLSHPLALRAYATHNMGSPSPASSARRSLTALASNSINNCSASLTNPDTPQQK